MKADHALGISKVDVLFELNVSVTPEGMGWALRDSRREHPRNLCPISGKGQKHDMPTIE